MIYPSIDKILEKIGSKYLLVNVVAQRAKEIKDSKPLQLPEKEYKCKKNIGRALEEISKGLIHFN